MLSIKVDDEIILKELEIETAAELFALIDSNRNYLREWLGWVDSTKVVDDTILYIQTISNENIFSERFVFEIWYKNMLAGLIDFHSGDSVNLKADIGYWLAEKFQGCGIMTRACNACLDYAFNSAGLNRVSIKCAEGNKKSIGVPLRLNFKLEGTEREGQNLNGKFVSLLVYSILKDDWNNRFLESSR